MCYSFQPLNTQTNFSINEGIKKLIKKRPIFKSYLNELNKKHIVESISYSGDVYSFSKISGELIKNENSCFKYKVDYLDTSTNTIKSFLL